MQIYLTFNNERFSFSQYFSNEIDFFKTPEAKTTCFNCNLTKKFIFIVIIFSFRSFFFQVSCYLLWLSFPSNLSIMSLFLRYIFFKFYLSFFVLISTSKFALVSLHSFILWTCAYHESCFILVFLRPLLFGFFGVFQKSPNQIVLFNRNMFDRRSHDNVTMAMEFICVYCLKY